MVLLRYCASAVPSTLKVRRKFGEGSVRVQRRFGSVRFSCDLVILYMHVQSSSTPTSRGPTQITPLISTLTLLAGTDQTTAVAVAEKVECMFNVQQQMLQKLDSNEGCIRNISYVLGLQLDMEITSSVPAHLPSTPGADPRGSTSLPPSTSTPGPVTSADTSIPPTAPPTELCTPASNATPQDGASTDLLTVRQSKEEKLIPPSEVVAKYPRLRGDCRM